MSSPRIALDGDISSYCTELHTKNYIHYTNQSLVNLCISSKNRCAYNRAKIYEVEQCKWLSSLVSGTVFVLLYMLSVIAISLHYCPNTEHFPCVVTSCNEQLNRV